LAGDWSQKGIKLNTPHFQQASGLGSSDTDADLRNEFGQKQQEPGSQKSAESGQRTGNGQAGRRSNAGATASTDNASSLEASSQDIISDTELKTYA